MTSREGRAGSTNRNMTAFAALPSATKLIEPLKGGAGFTGRRPGGKSRWTGKAQKMIRLEPRLVAELSADHISGGQFRHGSRLLRWRTDKAPQDCTMDQIKARVRV